MENSKANNNLQQSLLLFFLFLLMAMLFGAMIGTSAAAGIGLASGIQLDQIMATLDEDSPLGVRNYLRAANGVSHLFTFSIPAIAIGLYYYRNQIWKQFQLLKSPGLKVSALSVLFIICSYPLAQTLYWINRQLPLPNALTGMEESAEQLLKTLLVMNNPGELLLNLLVVAVLPAIGEELIFRGLIQKRLEGSFKNAIPAIWLAAAIFSAIHLQFEGFFPRLLLGAALGYLFYWTRNLWVPILAHFVFNGTQVLAQYFYSEEIAALEATEIDNPNWLWGVLSLAGIIFLGYIIKNTPKALTT